MSVINKTVRNILSCRCRTRLNTVSYSIIFKFIFLYSDGNQRFSLEKLNSTTLSSKHKQHWNKDPCWHDKRDNTKKDAQLMLPRGCNPGQPGLLTSQMPFKSSTSWRLIRLNSNACYCNERLRVRYRHSTNIDMSVRIGLGLFFVW